MAEVTAEDGCPGFEATVRADERELGRRSSRTVHCKGRHRARTCSST